MNVDEFYPFVFSYGDFLLYSKWPCDVERVFVDGKHENNQKVVLEVLPSANLDTGLNLVLTLDQHIPTAPWC